MSLIPRSSADHRTAPAPLRGTLTSVIFFFLGVGALLAQVINQAVLTSPLPRAWLFTVGSQLIPTVMLAVLLPFICGGSLKAFPFS